MYGLKDLGTNGNRLGWEGVAAIASSLSNLKILAIHGNIEIRQGVTLLGRLPRLKKLLASICGVDAEKTGTKRWTTLAFANQQRIKILDTSKEPRNYLNNGAGRQRQWRTALPRRSG